MSKIKLSDEEMVIVWSIVAWFQVEPLATSTLVRKFYPSLGNKQYKYDIQIEDRIIHIGKFLERKRLEALTTPVNSEAREGGNDE